MSLLLLKSMLFSNTMKPKKKKRKLKVQEHNNVPKMKYAGVNAICRTCNFEPGAVPIFNNKETPNIAEDILQFSGVAIIESDEMSKTMCVNCFILLKSCVMFRDMCRNSNKSQLNALIKQETKYVTNLDTNYHSDDSYNIPSPDFPDEEEPPVKEPLPENDLDLCNPECMVWKCEACNTDFNNKIIYNKHIAKCKIKITATKGVRRFLCDICGKTSHSNANLLAHMIIHENVFPFKCESCPYQGRTQDLLNVHKRTHLPEKPYKCSQCPKTTTTSSNLAKHMRHVHNKTRPYKCNYCDKAFSYQHDMKRHVRDIHLRQSTVQCDVCCKKFNTKKILQGHRWKIHKIKGDKQGRMPSYLQCQTATEERGNIQTDGNINNDRQCETQPQYNYEQNKDYTE